MTRDNAVATAAWDETYTHDNLDRLKYIRRGTLSGESLNSQVYLAEWCLDGLGNWKNYALDLNGNGDPTDAEDESQDREHNKANEIADTSGDTDAITEYPGQTSWADPAHDARGNMTTIPRPLSPASSYACTYDACFSTARPHTDPRHADEPPYDCLRFHGAGLRFVISRHFASRHSTATGTANSRYDEKKWKGAFPAYTPAYKR